MSNKSNDTAPEHHPVGSDARTELDAEMQRLRELEATYRQNETRRERVEAYPILKLWYSSNESLNPTQIVALRQKIITPR